MKLSSQPECRSNSGHSVGRFSPSCSLLSVRLLLCGMLCGLFNGGAFGQVLIHPDPTLDSIFPAGGQIGQTIEIELNGGQGFGGADRIVMEGPPGVTVADVQVKGASNQAVARLTIAGDAVPGRRWLRLAGGDNGLTNARAFFVTNWREPKEVEPNNTFEQAQDVEFPAVINARLEKSLDLDCFRFQGRAGQKLVAAILAHGMDATLRLSYNRGFLDTSLELLNAQGQTLASAEDSVGLDPVIHFTLPQDGAYVLRVKSVAFQGSPSAVYRLILGEVPYLTSIFPAGGQRGQTVPVELMGPNIPPGTVQPVSVASDPFLLQEVGLPGAEAPPRTLPFIRGDLPETIEAEPNDKEHASPLTLGSTANGRFVEPGDDDWYRVTLKGAQPVVFSTLAQRHLRAPVDTSLEIYDAAGTKLAENDDARVFMGQVWHDFEAVDSWLPFTPAADGEYFVRVVNGSGVYGPHTVYRLTLEPFGPDFVLFQWPDVVPIWGPGTTATFVAQAFTRGGLKSDVEIHVAGLPEGWQASVSRLPHGYLQPYMNTQIGGMALVSITAPAEVPVGTIVPFRVVGKTQHEERVIEHEAQTLTLYGNSHNDRMLLRYSTGAQAVVTRPLDSRIEALVTEVTATQGGKVDIPVKVERLGDPQKAMGLGIDGSTVAASTGWKAPTPVPPGQTVEMTLSLTISPEWRPGSYTIYVSRSWSADIRSGRPGPCSQAIRLNILEAK